MRTDLKFGDLICYRDAKPHDSPLMYVGPCGHGGLHGRPRTMTLIDILDIQNTYVFAVEHKDPAMWQVCRHRFDER